MKTKQERADIYQKVTDQIITAIEQGVDAWEMPWHRSASTPKNALTGKAYRGVNVLSLWATAASSNYRSGIWATYAQWQELGAQVRKGEKSAFIVFWKFPNNTDETEEGEEEENKRGPIARGYNVFNADQVDGYLLPDVPALPQTARIESRPFLRRYKCRPSLRWSARLLQQERRFHSATSLRRLQRVRCLLRHPSP